MSSSSGGDQLELPGTSASHERPTLRGLLGLALDREDFLRLLSAEWVHPAQGSRLLLGTEDAYALAASRGDAAVAVWFNPMKLPETTVMACRDGSWRETTLQALRQGDTVVAWGGPLPLFAVDHFEVNSESSAMHLRALARSFTDMTVPVQQFVVGKVAGLKPPGGIPPGRLPWAPPENWDALRGAAAMAAYAVPAIDPWVDLFCKILRRDDSSFEQAEGLHAPWWKLGLWSVHSDKWEALPALWRAIVDELGEAWRLKEWRAKAVLESICRKALALGESEERIQGLRSGALDLLNDRETVDVVASHGDDLALTLQLLLLRQTPQKFVTWREDWRPIPPVVWWTGMTLAGYLQGYRSLPSEFRGGTEGQKLLALKTWDVAGENGSGPWTSIAPEEISWDAGDESILLSADGKPWAEHKLGTRGRWYRADFADEVTFSEAENFAKTACPTVLGRVIVLSDLDVKYDGDGKFELDVKSKKLSVKGQVEFPLTSDVIVKSKLDVARFREWIATASIDTPVRRPPVTAGKSPRALETAQIYEIEVTEVQTPPENPARKKAGLPSEPKAKPIKKKTATRARTGAKDVDPPLGLRLQPEFLTPVEEADLVTTIDSLPWDTRMARWVQHYGWRYNYKARKVEPKDYIGPLPEWALVLASRLLELGLVAELPDQVIVNNYVGKQGIDKHTDCPACFRGPVTTVSLLETWDMVFTRGRPDGETERFVLPLPHGSAAVMDGEARSVWEHAIPPRLTQNGVPRVRRISITFRKIAIPT